MTYYEVESIVGTEKSVPGGLEVREEVRDEWAKRVASFQLGIRNYSDETCVV
jgi:hypothetical protein